MNKACINFIDTLIDISSIFSEVYETVVADWQPEAPPITTLFASMGIRMAEKFIEVDSETHKKWFKLIEEAMIGDDEVLLTAVATGLLEALATKAVEIGIWKYMAPHLGERSLAHAEMWLN